MDHMVGLSNLRLDNGLCLFAGNKGLCQIEEGLFLGSAADACRKSQLQDNNITHILTVAVALEPEFPSDFNYKKIEVVDREDTNLLQYFDECIDYIDKAKRSGGGVLVHCFMGVSRSVTIVVAYLMKKRGMSFSAAMEHVKNKRPQACPNSGFISQLRLFEKSLRAEKEAKTGIKISRASSEKRAADSDGHVDAEN